MKNKISSFSNISSPISSVKNIKESNERVADIIIDSFNELIQLNNQFKKKIKKKIDSIEYAYPDEGIKLKEIIDLFIDKSGKLSKYQMKRLLDNHLDVNFKYNSIQKSNLPKVTLKHNENWMKDWMEQANNYKKNPKVMTLIANYVEEFLHYADKVEGKYV